MEDLYIKASHRSPEVSFSAGKNELHIKGRSQPEDLLEFYDPVTRWFENYVIETAGPINLQIELDYFNTGSAKILFELLIKLKKVKERGVDYQVRWRYEGYDDDMREAAQHLADLTGVEIQLVASQS